MTAFDTAITQARDLLRWRSPLRTELWAARLAAELEEAGEAEEFSRRAAEDGRLEARLAVAAMAALDRPAEDPVEGKGELPGWVRRMGRVTCDGAWYGKADPYGEQVLAVLAFRYENGKEPHIVVTGIDQPHGGLAVDALVEELKFLDDLGLREAEPGVVAGRTLDAFELGDRLMGAEVAETLPAIRPLAVSRARSVPGLVRGGAPDGAMAAFQDLPDLPGAEEAFGKLTEFVGDRPLWWSPGRVRQFLTSWLPREAILSQEAIEAMPEVVRAWTRHCGDQPAVLRQIDEDAPRLPALMADDSLAGLGKRLAQQNLPD
ncbi:hypothetical protein B0I32_122208 [Nonomuraea fuscirosea]|uniref:Uncharacterized protein n=2 Tax=Nonomuraea fuscirosea TaxID=1291556 RepID=A0A2T0MM20_9ACTN|nr:hypothetical protein B0I32_122208 [Nonomuraea fuscirosea]